MAGQAGRQMGLHVAVAAVLGDHQTPAQGLTRAVRIGIAEGEPVGEQREREDKRVAGRLGGIDQSGRGGHRVVSATGDHQCLD
jgi:hypothetical protein